MLAGRSELVLVLAALLKETKLHHLINAVKYNGILVLVRTSSGLRRPGDKT